jgi:hypothetical protein
MLYVFILFTLTYPVQQSLQEIVKKTIGLYTTNIIALLTSHILSYRVDWLETASFGLGEDFYPG